MAEVISQQYSFWRNDMITGIRKDNNHYDKDI